MRTKKERALTTLMYVYGFMDAEGTLSKELGGKSDINDAVKVCETIVSNWIKGIDIQNDIEKQLVMEYGKRILKGG